MSAWDRMIAWWTSTLGKSTAAGIGIVLVALLFFFPDKPGPAASALSTRTTAAAPAALVVTRIDTNTFERWEMATLYVQILNRGNDSLTGLNLQVLAPGFELTQPQSGSCTKQDGTPTNTLKPAEACSFSIPLKALAGSGIYGVAVKAGWFQHQPESLLLPVGTVHMQGTIGADALQRFGQRLAAVFKDLTFPILVLLLTTQLGQWQKDREDARADAQKKVEDAETERQMKVARENAIADQKRADQQQVRQLLLTKVNSMSEKYYLKISSAGKGVLDAYADLEARKETSTTRPFYNMMLIVRHMTLLKDECGGIFLADRKAEKIVFMAWGLLKPTLFAVVTEDQVADALKSLATDSTYVEFNKNIAALAVGAKRFTSWYDGTDAALTAAHGRLKDFNPVVDVLQGVLLYETNTPLGEYWYRYAAGLRYSSGVFKSPAPPVMTASQIKAASELPDAFEEYRKETESPKNFPA